MKVIHDYLLCGVDCLEDDLVLIAATELLVGEDNTVENDHFRGHRHIRT